jgi:uncharacterized damage-inducible protein DinB
MPRKWDESPERARVHLVPVRNGAGHRDAVTTGYGGAPRRVIEFGRSREARRKLCAHGWHACTNPFPEIMSPMTTAIHRPAATEYAPYFARYVERVPEGDIVALLRENSAILNASIATLDEARGAYRSAEGKWSIREMLGHLMDVERVFVYRALSIARGDTTPLPGFDQDDYAATAGSDARRLSDLREELRALRESTVRFFASPPLDAWARVGVASGNDISVRAIAHIIVGHTEHHLQVLAERYGVPTIR